MSNRVTSLGLANRCRFGRNRLGSLMATASIILCSTAMAQAASDSDNIFGIDDMTKLYDCSGFYKLVNYCYSRDDTEASRRVSAVTAENMDKVTHLIFTNGRRNGILDETSLKDMLASFNKIMDSTDHACKNIARPISKYRSSCDRIIEDVPKQPYNDGKKSGDLGGYVPATFRPH